MKPIDERMQKRNYRCTQEINQTDQNEIHVVCTLLRLVAFMKVNFPTLYVELAPPKPLITYERKQLQSCGSTEKSTAKQHQNSKLGLLLHGKMSFSNFYTNLYGATKSHNITA